MQHHDLEVRARAVALVRSGYSCRAAGRSVGASEASVRRWLSGANRRETTHEKEVDVRAADIRERLLLKQEAARELLLDRILAATEAASLRDAATAFGILSDKLRLDRGEPTQIVRADRDFSEHVNSLSDEQLEVELEQFMAPLIPASTERSSAKET